MIPITLFEADEKIDSGDISWILVKRDDAVWLAYFPCYSHTKEDLDYTLNVFEDVMKVYKKALKSGNPSSYMEGTPLKIVLG